MIYVVVSLRMYVWTLSIYVCVNLIDMCCWFNHHFGLLVHLASSLWCIFARVFPSKLCISTGFQGVHLFHFPCVRTIHAPSLACCAGHALATNKDILLASTHNHGQENIARPIIGTHTPNGLRSSWDFLPGRSPDMLVGLALLAVLVLEGGLDDKMSPHILFWIFSCLSWISLDSSLRDVYPMLNMSTSWGSFMISCWNSRTMVKAKWFGLSAYRTSLHYLRM